jgi:hypothetical protein
MIAVFLFGCGVGFIFGILVTAWLWDYRGQW